MFLYFLLSKWWAFCCCYCSKFHFWIVFLLFVKVVAVAVFLALGFAFYVFFAPFVGKKLFQYIVMGLYTPLVSPLSLSMSTFFFGSVEELRSILSLLLVSHSCLVVRIIFSWTPFTFWGLLLSQNIFFVVGPLNCKLLALS